MNHYKVKQKCLLEQVAGSQAKIKPVTSQIQNGINLRSVQKTSLILRCRYVRDEFFVSSYHQEHLLYL